MVFISYFIPFLRTSGQLSEDFEKIYCGYTKALIVWSIVWSLRKIFGPYLPVQTSFQLVRTSKLQSEYFALRTLQLVNKSIVLHSETVCKPKLVCVLSKEQRLLPCYSVKSCFCPFFTRAATRTSQSIKLLPFTKCQSVLKFLAFFIRD